MQICIKIAPILLIPVNVIEIIYTESEIMDYGKAYLRTLGKEEKLTIEEQIKKYNVSDEIEKRIDQALHKGVL